MDLYSMLRPALFAHSQDDAEVAHDLARKWLACAQESPFLLRQLERMADIGASKKPTTVAGLTFPNRVGFPAGFDKQGEFPLVLQALGFGFGTIGSVLPREQSGNPRPRIFRIPERQAIINRLGFNSHGAGVVLKRLMRVRPSITIPLGVSLGKMLTTPVEDIEAVARDFAETMEVMWGVADYFEYCISSPNTPGLRNLQKREYLETFLRLMNIARARLRGIGEAYKPVFLKLAPDLSPAEVDDILAICSGADPKLIDSYVISNTTFDRQWMQGLPHADEQGGLSGRPVYQKMKSLLIHVRKADPDVPIIAVGGIDGSYRAKEAFGLGANLIQMYTGVVYRGPKAIREARLAAINF